MFEERPWGHYKIEKTADDHQIKTIFVKSGQRLSLQTHNFRAEHWFCISGKGVLTYGDAEFTFGPGDSIDIPVNVAHRIAAKTDLTFIEVQTGTYFGEDDIVRLQDDYNR